MNEKKILDKSDLRKLLNAEEYHVCCEHGTETPFTGKYWDNKEPGIYKCVCCGEPLFDAASKFDSGTGWPSYWEPVTANSVASCEDLSHGMRRMEVTCASCGSHLGHVFPDGPAPTGLRYCINSAALKFNPEN